MDTMPRLVRLWKALAMSVFAIMMTGCASNPSASAAERTKADEAAIRRTITELEQRINRGDPGFVSIFAKDAVIIAPAAADVVGFDAIQAMYSGLMKQASMTVHFSTDEVAVAGDLAYERGTYTLKITDKASGRVLQDVKNKHLHIMKRQQDGTWKTWRMMVNSAKPAADKK
jgi:uncharacterized protein (TIGR02246 family)